MEEWKEYKLKDVATLTTGFPFDGHKYSKEGIRVVRGDNVTIGCLRWDSDKDKRWAENFDRASEFTLYEGDIVIGMDGSRVGKNRAQVKQEDLPLLIAQRVACVRHNELSLQSFLYYQIFSDSFEQYIKAVHTGTSIPHVSLKQIGDFPIVLPPLSAQKKISSILKSLDDKIEVNRKINENLEQQAQALFKSWFVDFEPFKNGEFVESELGMIPKGWRVVELSNLAEISKVSINPFKQPRTVFEHYSIPSYDNGMKPEIQLGEDIKSNKFVIENKMILFSKLNPRIKRVWYVDNLGVTPVCSTEFVPYKAIGESKSSFLYGLITSQGFYDFVMSMVNGATGSHQRFHPEESLKYKVAYNEEYCERYSAIITPILNQILVIRDESRRLAELRDTLLPKLMSGEIKV